MDVLTLAVVIEREGGHPNRAALYRCGEDGKPLEWWGGEEFGPFDSLYDVLHWVAVASIRQEKARAV